MERSPARERRERRVVMEAGWAWLLNSSTVNRIGGAWPAPKPLPEFSPDRLLDRVAEALQAAAEPARFKKFPAWTQRVKGIAQEQFVPR